MLSGVAAARSRSFCCSNGLSLSTARRAYGCLQFAGLARRARGRSRPGPAACCPDPSPPSPRPYLPLRIPFCSVGPLRGRELFDTRYSASYDSLALTLGRQRRRVAHAAAFGCGDAARLVAWPSGRLGLATGPGPRQALVLVTSATESAQRWPEIQLAGGRSAALAGSCAREGTVTCGRFVLPLPCQAIPEPLRRPRGALR
jgi:hypothetical protein